MTAARRARLEVGTVVRPHGLKGDVVVRLVSNLDDRLAPGARLDAAGAELVVASARPLQKDRHVVHFEGCASVEDAEALRGTVLFGAPLEREGVLWVDELVGARMVATDGTEIGEIVAVEANPASDLLVLADGALVPARFVVGDVVDGVVVVEVPEGLFE